MEDNNNIKARDFDEDLKNSNKKEVRYSNI